MSEEDICFPPIQVSTFIKGDQYVFRAKDGPDLEKTLVSAAESMNGALDALRDIKQAVLAKGVLTGDSQGGGKPAAAASTASSSGGKARAKDTAPPGDDGNPTCAHGPMLDLRGGKKKDGTPYAADFYCTYDGKDWKNKCSPVKV